MIAAILAAAMSNLSSSLNSLASTTIVDFYQPFLRKIRASRTSCASHDGSPSFGAWCSRSWRFFPWREICSGSRPDDRLHHLRKHARRFSPRRANKKGKRKGIHHRNGRRPGSMLAIWYFGTIAFTWYVLIGTAITFVTGYAASVCFSRQSAVGSRQ